MEKAKFYDQFMQDTFRRDLLYINYRVEAIGELVKKFVPKGSKVLEIGCGNGLVTRHLAKRAEQLLAVDISPQAIENAKRYVNQDNCEFRVADILRNDVKGYYDVIVLADVIEHIEFINREILFTLIEQKLLPLGTVIMTWPNPKAQLASKQIIEEPTHIQMLLPYTNLKLFYFSYVDVDGKNQYVHCVFKAGIDYYAPLPKSFLRRCKNLIKKTWQRLINIRLLYWPV